MKQNPLKPHMRLFKPHKIASRDLLGFFPLTGGVRDQQNPPASVIDQNEEQTYTLDSLKQIITEILATTRQKQRQKTCLYLTRVARIIDVTFLVLYIITVIVFLSVLGKLWIPQ